MSDTIIEVNIATLELRSTASGAGLLARIGAGELGLIDPAAVGGSGSGGGGNSILSGSGAPSNALGDNGDFYLDTASSDHNLYGPKASGVWPAPVALKGAPGTSGSTGSVLRSGSGAPSNALGANGDFYLDTASVSYNLYGPKAGGVWPAPFALKGPAGSGNDPGVQGDPGPPGVDGKSVLTGSGVPSNAFGANGDVYVDLASVERYLYGPKAGGVWPGSPVSLRGPPGPPGTPGAAGADATLGNTAAVALGATASAGVATTAARSDHRHAFPTVTDIGAAPAAHTQSIATVTGLQLALDGKAPALHGHTLSEVTGATAALAAKQDISTKNLPNGYAGIGADGKIPPTLYVSGSGGGGTANLDNGTADGQLPVWNQAELKYKPEAQLPITRDRDTVVERTSATALTFDDYHRHIIVLAGIAPLTLAASEIGTAPFQGMSFVVENDHTAQNTLTFGAGITVKQPSTGTGTAGQVKIPVDGQLAVLVYPKGGGLIAKCRGDVA